MKPDAKERLAFLVRVVEKEIRHLRYSEAQVFDQPITAERMSTLNTDEPLAEKVEAYSSRFCRLQDTLGDKLLPAWLNALGERTGAAIDNLDKAEKLGLLASADEWMMIRQIRNQMVHEYIEAPEILANALQTAQKYQQTLLNFANALETDLRNRKLR